jgi:hypothetical protein
VVPGEFVRAGAKAAHVELKGVKVVSGSDAATGDNCVFVPREASNVKVIVGEGTELTSYGAAAIQCNGNTVDLEVVVKGKVVSVGKHAMYLPRVETCTLGAGAEVAGVTGVEIRGGSLVVEAGAKVAGEADKFEVNANGNGSTVNGVAIAVAPHSTDLDINVTVGGGEFAGAYAIYEFNSQPVRNGKTAIVINGGTFNVPIYCEHCTVAESVTVKNDFKKQ